MKNEYFRRNNNPEKFIKGFTYKGVKEYDTLSEWLLNVYLSENENASLATGGSNLISILDDRLGYRYSLMSMRLPDSKIDELKQSEDAALGFLTLYYHNNH
jgi:hypothetical protein